MQCRYHYIRQLLGYIVELQSCANVIADGKRGTKAYCRSCRQTLVPVISCSMPSRTKPTRRWGCSTTLHIVPLWLATSWCLLLYFYITQVAATGFMCTSIYRIIVCLLSRPRDAVCLVNRYVVCLRSRYAACLHLYDYLIETTYAYLVDMHPPWDQEGPLSALTWEDWPGHSLLSDSSPWHSVIRRVPDSHAAADVQARLVPEVRHAFLTRQVPIIHVHVHDSAVDDWLISQYWNLDKNVAKLALRQLKLFWLLPNCMFVQQSVTIEPRKPFLWIFLCFHISMLKATVSFYSLALFHGTMLQSGAKTCDRKGGPEGLQLLLHPLRRGGDNRVEWGDTVLSDKVHTPSGNAVWGKLYTGSI